MYQLTWSQSAKGRRNGIKPLSVPPPDPRISAAAALVWEEHCVECAVPSCYASCPLYVRRADGKCSRFAQGIFPNRHFTGLYPFGADIRFRRWGKLEAYWPGRPGLHGAARLRRLAAGPDRVERLETVLRRLPLPMNGAFRLGERLRKVRKRMIRKTFAGNPGDSETPDALFIRFYSPADGNFRLQLEIDREGRVPKQNPIVFRRSLDVVPGWNEHRIAASELPVEPGKVRVWPDDDAELHLIFTWLDLVAFEKVPDETTKTGSEPAARVKCVAWDLDGTLWDGIIGEDGPDGGVSRPGALDLVRALDARGIIQTVASKNDFDQAWSKVEDLGLAEYFLYPAIHWGPKSGSLKDIARELNINVDTFAFIDDSPFERAEVTAALPQVRVYDAAEVSGLLERPEFDVPVTEASRLRRHSYLAEARRKNVGASWDGGIEDFLKSCHMVMRVAPPAAEQAARCLEPLQRSNQFNLSGRRYSAEQFDALLADPGAECFAFDMSDDFGGYGIVGFAVVQREADGPVLVDFVMSCRVARKRVEESFLCWYAARARRRGETSLRVRMRPTESNGPLRDALAAVAIPRAAHQADGADGVFLFDLTAEVDIPPVIRIEDMEAGTMNGSRKAD